MRNKNSLEIRQLINLIENFRNETSINVLENYIGHLLDDYPVNYFYLISNEMEELNNDGYGIHRSRRINNIDEIKTETDMWEPPPQLIVNPGRMNKKYESVLYCSNHITTTFAELDAKVGDLFATARLSRQSNSELPHLKLISFGEYLDNYFKFKRFNSDGHKKIRPQLNRKDRIKYDLINDYLVALFRRKKNDDKIFLYLKTALITEFYKREIKVDGFFYPSVKASYGSYNLALSPISAKKHLEIKSIVFYRIKKISSTRYDFSIEGKLESKKN